MDNKQFKELIDRLDKIAKIIATTSTQGYTTIDRIYMLNKAGFGPSEIAEIIGTSSNVVNVRLSELRKIEGKKNG